MKTFLKLRKRLQTAESRGFEQGYRKALEDYASFVKAEANRHFDNGYQQAQVDLEQQRINV